MATLAVPLPRVGSGSRFLLGAVFGSLVLALFAQVSFPIGPVPITGQTLGVLLIGVMLGSRGAAAAATLYLIEGAAGLPVFAGFIGGPLAFVSPSAGYLLAFVPGAWLAGWFVEQRWNRTFAGSIGAMLGVHLLILAAGAAWLTMFFPIGVAVQTGFVVFVPVAMVKTLLALPVYWRPRCRV